MGMNLSLTNNHSKHLTSASTDLDNTKDQHQQPVLNVIYENNNNNNVESSGEHVFASQLDSFEMDHIALQVRSIYDKFSI